MMSYDFWSAADTRLRQKTERARNSLPTEEAFTFRSCFLIWGFPDTGGAIPIKIEAQDQEVDYHPVIVNIRGCGFYFPLPVPPDPVLCSMKATAVIDRGKGRDYYDLMFLLGQTKPDYSFLCTKRNS
ncbi:MAG: nucleotidyl transferase AbiEii/AbiGii toxin family protein [Marinilabiliales bacterium]|nr:nucleotidyl transferase AbiEii/AbiGii toxin family protein [Marinilabiliales bacterium]